MLPIEFRRWKITNIFMLKIEQIYNTPMGLNFKIVAEMVTKFVTFHYYIILIVYFPLKMYGKNHCSIEITW